MSEPEPKPDKPEQKKLVDTGNKEPEKIVFTARELDVFASMITVEWNGICYVRCKELADFCNRVATYMERIHRVTIGEITDRIRSHGDVSRTQFKTLYDILKKYKAVAAEKMIYVDDILAESERLVAFIEQKVEEKRAELSMGSVKVVKQFTEAMKL